MSEKRVKLTLVRLVPQAYDLSVTFGVSEEKSTNFQSALQDFLSFCETQLECLIRVEVVSDGETGEDTDLIVKIRGNQRRLAHEFQQRADTFIDNSEWSL